MGGVEVLQTRVPAEVAAQVDEIRGGQSRADWLRALVGAAVEPATVTPEPVPGGAVAAAEPVPCPGVLCMWARCGARDTSRYGVADPGVLARSDYRLRPRDEDEAGHALCPAHAALLSGLIYRRPVPPGAVRALGVPVA
jgi:hypothetical protein